VALRKTVRTGAGGLLLSAMGRDEDYGSSNYEVHLPSAVCAHSLPKTVPGMNTEGQRPAFDLVTVPNKKPSGSGWLKHRQVHQSDILSLLWRNWVIF
jgi:hypothetical protein